MHVFHVTPLLIASALLVGEFSIAWASSNEYQVKWIRKMWRKPGWHQLDGGTDGGWSAKGLWKMIEEHDPLDPEDKCVGRVLCKVHYKVMLSDRSPLYATYDEDFDTNGQPDWVDMTNEDGRVLKPHHENLQVMKDGALEEAEYLRWPEFLTSMLPRLHIGDKVQTLTLPTMAWGSMGDRYLGIPPTAMILAEIHLLDVKPKPEDESEKLEL
eukprot:gnl/TRDRNA2_/TRDRNA2_134826_c0_seq1.p1 gnl/TRDRNA2_/TRDRNA2_134826_c0~~gnl/TRDRNA2_/TRDRNA2_134826_c0_seq1.p1  ORF type:complete len:247 (+),score=28.78 gnl/TRDRNA2_/TRDRNA2_134826_c0_seq1:106-741(+)